MCVIYVREDNDSNVQAMITRLTWTSLSAVLRLCVYFRSVWASHPPCLNSWVYHMCVLQIRVGLPSSMLTLLGLWYVCTSDLCGPPLLHAYTPGFIICVYFRSVWASPPPCLHSWVYHMCVLQIRVGLPLFHAYTPGFIICVYFRSVWSSPPPCLHFWVYRMCVLQICVGLPSSMLTLLGLSYVCTSDLCGPPLLHAYTPGFIICVYFRSVWTSPPPCLHSWVFICQSFGRDILWYGAVGRLSARPSVCPSSCKHVKT